jgi:hypothetical protein
MEVQVSESEGMANGKKCALDARLLRGLGEKADSMRDQDLVLVRINDPRAEQGPTYDIMTKPAYEAARKDGPRHYEHIEDVRTPSGIPPRAWMSVEIETRHGRVKIPPETDAAFWSISALEKFTWPYYEGMRIWRPGYLQGLKKAIKSDSVVGVVHIGESSTLAINSNEPGRLVVDSPRLDGGPTLMTLEDFEAHKL